MRNVTIAHPRYGTAQVTEEVATYQQRHGWTRTGQAKAAPQVTPQAMPTKAGDLVDWIGDDPDRAEQAATAEAALGDKARTTVLDHIAQVLDTTNPEASASPSQEA